MEVILFLVVIGCFVWLMLRRGSFNADGQPPAVERTSWAHDPILHAEPAPDEWRSVETHGWPHEDSPHWRLGRRGRIFTGGDGMSIHGACFSSGGGGGDGGC